MNDKKIVAIVPMRHNSERISGKNYRDFAGKPLFFHIINSLLECKSIENIVVDTDSQFIMDLIYKNFPEIIVRERPSHLRDGGIPMNDVLLNIVEHHPADFYLQTHSTNPILSSATIEAAVEKYLHLFPTYDSLFSVTRKNVRYWNQLSLPINHNPSILLRTQDLPPVFEENSCLYIFTKEIITQNYNRIGKRPYLFEISEIEAQDIDVEINFKVAEYLFKEIHLK